MTVQRNEAIRLGVIGFGIMGERLLRAALDHDAAVVNAAGVWDPSAEAMQRLARDLPQVKPFASAAEVIGAADCIYVASPPAFHLNYAREAFARGRAVFCEKPLAVDVADAKAFVQEADAAGARGAVNFPFTSAPAVDQLQRWMAEDVVGLVQAVEVEIGFAQWPRPWQVDAAGWLDARAQGGYVREVGSHFLFLARRLFGPLQLETSTISYAEAGKSERAMTAELRAGSVPVSIRSGVGTTAKPDHNTFRITGPKGSIRLRDWAIAERLVDGEWREAPDSLPNEALRSLVLKRQIEKVAALTHGRPQNLASLQEAAEVQRIVETILRG